MDLYSTAKHTSRPFVFTENDSGADQPIGAHGVIGDGFSAALVRVDGAIDWLCMPRFDSPSLFAAILDPDKGGFAAITPSRPFESLQRYDPDTNVLETLFTVEGQGVARLTDFMPWVDDPRAAIHEVHRRIECLEGRVDVDVIFDPRFSYGADPAEIEIGSTASSRSAGTVSASSRLSVGAIRGLGDQRVACKPASVCAPDNACGT